MRRKRRRNPWFGAWLTAPLFGPTPPAVSPVIPAKKPRKKIKRKPAKRKAKSSTCPYSKPMTEKQAMRIVEAHLRRRRRRGRK